MLRSRTAFSTRYSAAGIGCHSSNSSLKEKRLRRPLRAKQTNDTDISEIEK